VHTYVDARRQVPSWLASGVWGDEKVKVGLAEAEGRSGVPGR
jgi:hypothetical protein